jgi:seryl-tRNA(Sec) selenium transferase
MRLDKLRLDVLLTVLQAHLGGAGDALPTHRALNASAEALAEVATALAAALADPRVTAVPTEDAVGGGAHPERPLPGAGLRVATPDPRALAARLREGAPGLPAVVGRVDAHAVTLALRAIPPGDLPLLVAALQRALDTRPSAR